MSVNPIDTIFNSAFDIFFMILIYIARIGVWIGVFLLIRRFSNFIIFKGRNRFQSRLEKELIIFIVSLSFYLILLSL